MHFFQVSFVSNGEGRLECVDGQDKRDIWLEQAMTRWEVPLLRTCYLLLRDAVLAEDAVQDTFVKAWRYYDGYRKEASEKTWLMRIAVNTCRDLQRSKWFIHIDRRVNTADLPEATVPFEPPDDTMITAILSLPIGLRQVIVLRYFQGFTVQEVAEALCLSRRTVHYRLDKAKRYLKSSLEEWYNVQ